MIDVKLRYVTQCHFGRSEMTNFDALPTDAKALLRAPMDAVLLVSMGGNQLCFVYRPTDDRTVLSVRVRLRHGTWNPLMLGDYAAGVGLNIVGLKRFADHYQRLTEEHKQ